jgi:hypothetical protein
MATRTSQPQTSAGAKELDFVDHLVRHVGVYPRDVVVNYYVALKSTRFVIVAGPPEVDKTRLAQGVADILVGRHGLQWCLFQAHPWWSTRTRAPGGLAVAHAQFNNLKLTDSIEAAVDNEASGLPIFVNIERMSPAEVACYFEDLPRGLLWQADASMRRIHLPENLYVTGTLNTGGESTILGQEVHRHTTVIHADRAAAASSTGFHEAPTGRPHWQRGFVAWTIRCSNRARAKLSQILPGSHDPLAPLVKLSHELGMAALSPFVLEQAWLYLANAFDDDGRGLFAEPAIENLHIAQDYVLAQHVLPYVSHHLADRRRMWERVSDYLAARFPRAHTWGENLREQRLSA